MNAIINPALAARNRQRVDDAARKARNAERRKVVDLATLQTSPVEPVRLGRDVEEAAWRDPDDVAVNRRTPKMVSGFRTVSALVMLEKRGAITVEHVAAGVRLLDDHEIAEGAAGGERSEIRGASNPGGPGDAQLAALARYGAAIQAIGQRAAPLVCHVCLHNMSLTNWSEKHGKSVSEVSGAFKASMDRLAEHYQIDLDDVRRVEV